MIDIIIVFVYLLFILVVGILTKSNTESFKSYATITDRIKKNKLMLVATIFASSVGGGATFGIAEKAFSSDLSYTYGLLLTIPLDILIAIYLIPKIVKHYGAQTVGDIMHKYYGPPGRFITGTAVIVFSIGLLAAQISVSGRIFQYILEVNYLEGVILSYSIVIIYTTIGGLRSIVFTNLIQFLAMVLAIPAITIVGIGKIGCYNFIDQVPLDKVNIYTNLDLFYNTISIALGFSVMILQPNFIQRILINNNPIQTRNAVFIKTFIYSVFVIFTTLNGLIAYNLYPEQIGSLALPHLINSIIPEGLQGFVVVGLLAAVMSTADSDLNITSISLVKDILGPIFHIRNQQKLLLIARCVNILIGSFAIVIALSFASVLDLVIFVAGFWSTIVIVPLIFALFGITVPIPGMIMSSLIGASSFLIWEIYFSFINLKGVFVGTVASMLVFLISLITKNRFAVSKAA